MKKAAGILSLVLALGLVGCQSSVTTNGSTDKSKLAVEDKTKSEDKVQNDDKTKSTEDNKVKNIEEGKSKEKTESKNQQSRKQEYKTKLDSIDMGLKYLDEKEASGTTADMKTSANERYKRWDTALNEIYGVLKGQLSASDMKKLQNEEIKWISNRDAKAKAAASEMKGGTMEPVLYIASLADTTKKRCYELVERYMQ